MAREGAHAIAVRTVTPSLTFPGHTTLVTGALPARHGIHHNTPFEPTGQTGRWFWDAESIRVPTLWEAVREAGGTTAAVLWPVTRGAAIDWNLPDVGLGDEAMTRMAAASTPAGLIEELEREATGRLRRHPFHHMAVVDQMAAISAYLVERYRPWLVLVHLTATDHYQHAEGRDGPMVRRAVAATDRAVARIVEAAQRAGIAERTAFLVTGDHGFADIRTRVHPNVWLTSAGLMEPRPDRGRWLAAFHTGGGSAFLHLSGSAGRESTLDRVRSALAALPAGDRELFRVVERDELDRIGADPSAALALAAASGVAFGARTTGAAKEPVSGGAHGYFPEHPDIATGFLGWGRGLRPGAVVPLLRQEDVAPLVAALLGVDFRPPDGMLHAGLLVPD